MIRTTGKQKNYELVEYVNDVNREHTEVLLELNINGIMDTAYSYGNERLTNERFTGWTGYYTYDPRGSVSGVTDSEGMIWQSYRYDGYGNITFGQPRYNNVYAYNGESYNPNADAQYLRARYYCPGTVDFLTEDSYLGNLRDPLTLNRYSYVKSSPLNYIDPSGHHWTDIFPWNWGKKDDKYEKISVPTTAPTTASPKDVEIYIEVPETTTSAALQESVLEAENANNSTTCQYVVTAELMIELHWEPMTQEEIDVLNDVLKRYGINTISKMAFFFAQTRQETLGGYYRTEINWNFTGDDEAYFNQKYGPETNAGKLIGNTEEGDGYLYRGSGAIQLTGRYNYQKFSEKMNDPKIMELGADYVAEYYFWEAAGYYWEMKGINSKIEDGATSDEISRIVNYYDQASFEERKQKYDEAYKTLTEWFGD